MGGEAGVRQFKGIVTAGGGPTTYQVCVRCVMDTSDPDIAFDSVGVCSHCLRFDTEVAMYASSRRAPGRLERVVEQVKRAGRGRAYDCVIGVSGGVDSTYALLAASHLGLRPLAVHLDNGWDREVAIANIERAITKLGVDLHTHVLDWDSFRDLQVAFLKASTPDAEIPTDQAIFASLYDVASRLRIKHVITGENKATESSRVPAWSQGQSDWRYVRSVHRAFGTRPLRNYPRLTITKFTWYSTVRRIRWISILDYMKYDKESALKELATELGFVPYEGKHGESTYTRFYQGYILPRKFGYDKRRVHLSDLIRVGQMDRSEALHALEQPPYPPDMQVRDLEFVIKKLGMSRSEFEEIMAAPPRRFEEFPSYAGLFRRFPTAIEWARRIKRAGG